MNKPELNPKQLSMLRSMSNYWTEVEKRESNRAPIFREEMANLKGILTDMEILGIISNHVNSILEQSHEEIHPPVH